MPKNKIERAKTKIALNDRLLSYILSHFPIDLNYEGSTAATNGKVIFFNKEFLNSLSVPEVEFILLHELLHITLDHLARRESRNHKLFNIAADIVINDTLVASRYKPGNLKLLRGREFNIFGIRHSTEEVYEMLKKEMIGDDLLVTNHYMWDDKNRANVKDIINEGINKGYSSNNEQINRLINSVVGKTVNWKKVLEDILDKVDKDYHFSKPDSRFSEIILPSFEVDSETLNDAWLVVDVSGSMINNDVAKVFNEINGIVKSFDSVELKVSFFSTHVTKPHTVTNLKELQNSFNNIESSGGTSFEVIFDYLDNNISNKPKAVIIFTDGYANFPHESRARGIELFWIINNSNVRVPYGYRVEI